MSSIKQAIVLAGGKGTRLRSVVSDLPKPMAEVAGRPFLSYVLDELLKWKVETVVLSVGYKHEVIQAHFGKNYNGIQLHYAVEETALGTGGGVRFAQELLPERSDYFLLNGDTLFKTDLRAMETVHTRESALVTVSAVHMQTPDRYGTILFEGNRITKFREKQEGLAEGWINAGVYIINPKTFDDIEKEIFSFEEEVLEKNKELAVYPGEGYFIDIGIPEDYKKANDDLKKT